MKLDDFDFELPEALIATRPARPRSSAKMLVVDGTETLDLSVADLPSMLRKGDRLILNDTRVIPARLTGFRPRQTAEGEVRAKIEVTLMEPQADGTWSALAKPMRKLKLNENIIFSNALQANVKAMDESLRLSFNLTGDDFDTALNTAGAMPLPPYIAGKRAPDAQDLDDYQTIWAKHLGAVAAPTASLHFDAPLMAALKAKGIDITYVTLHVGAGTFLPVTVEDVMTHKMHAEWGEVSADACAQINATKAAGNRIIPVGTTALRLIESASQNQTIHPFQGTTEIFIYPGYTWQMTDALMTNFHLPKSTLLMLVAALMGKPRMDAVYAHAIANQYRFFSYGDASLLIPS